jgi:hypothetical protein
MCAPHWRRLPASVRHHVWATYKPGEADLGGAEHQAAIKNAVAWARKASRKDMPK